MRVATLFKRVLRLGRGRVVGFELVEEDGAEQVVVEVALTERRVMRCLRVRDAGAHRRRHPAGELAASRPRPDPMPHPLPGAARGVSGVRGAQRGRAVGQSRIPVHESLRGHLRARAFVD